MGLFENEAHIEIESKLTFATLQAEEILRNWSSDIQKLQQDANEIFSQSNHQEGDTFRHVDLLLTGMNPIEIKVLDGKSMQGLRGAYAAPSINQEEIVFINSSWLKTSTIREIAAVLLEEVGHAIDQRLNPGNDTPGDEGAIFSSLLLGEPYDPNERNQNDITSLIINSQHIIIEASSWNQRGNDFVGNLDDNLSPVSLSSDGQRIAVARPGYDTSGTLREGNTSIYEWNGSSWQILGSSITGEYQGDGDNGLSLSLSANGSRIAIGSPSNASNGNYHSNYGHVRVYDWSGTSWIQAGSDIDGKAEANTYFGNDVALSADGTRLISGGLGYDNGNSNTETGYAAVYDWDGSTWNPVGTVDNSAANGTGTDIGIFLGTQSNSRYGEVVDISADGSTIAIGIEHFGRINNNKVGQVEIYRLTSGNWNKIGSFTGGSNDQLGSGFSLSSDGSIRAS